MEFSLHHVYMYLFSKQQVQQKWPEGVPQTINVRCVSVDGDADRVIYSFLDTNKEYHMLDGDKIATLVAGYLKELLQKSG